MLLENFIMKLIKTRDYIIGMVIILAVFITGLFCDKSFAKNVISWNSGKIGTGISSYFLLIYFFADFVIGFSIVLTAIEIAKKKMGIILMIVAIACMGAVAYFAYKELKELYAIYGENAGKIVNIITIIITIGLAFLFSYFVLYKKADHKKIFIYSLILLVSTLLVLGFQVGCKYLWCRPRPYVCIPDGSSVDFRSWWQLKPFGGKGDEFKSCPSGHSMSGMMVTGSVMCYSSLFEKTNNGKVRVALFYCCLAFALIMGFCRNLAGMHFLSDVSFGFALSLTIIFISFTIADKKIISKYVNQKEEI